MREFNTDQPKVPVTEMSMVDLHRFAIANGHAELQQVLDVCSHNEEYITDHQSLIASTVHLSILLAEYKNNFYKYLSLTSLPIEIKTKE